MNRKNLKCDFGAGCFKCPFVDCINNSPPTEKEKEMFAASELHKETKGNRENDSCKRRNCQSNNKRV